MLCCFPYFSTLTSKSRIEEVKQSIRPVQNREWDYDNGYSLLGGKLTDLQIVHPAAAVDPLVEGPLVPPLPEHLLVPCVNGDPPAVVVHLPHALLLYAVHKRVEHHLHCTTICGNLVPLISGAPPDFRGNAPGIRGRLCLILRFKLWKLYPKFKLCL